MMYSYTFIQYSLNHEEKLLGQLLGYITMADKFLKQRCFIRLFFAVFSIFNVIGFYKSTKFDFEFTLLIPVIC